MGHAGSVLGMIGGHKSTCELRRIKVVEEREEGWAWCCHWHAHSWLEGGKHALHPMRHNK